MPPPSVKPWAWVPSPVLCGTLVSATLECASCPVLHVVLCVDILPLTHRDDYLVCESSIYLPLPRVWSRGAVSERDFMELS